MCSDSCCFRLPPLLDIYIARGLSTTELGLQKTRPHSAEKAFRSISYCMAKQQEPRTPPKSWKGDPQQCPPHPHLSEVVWVSRQPPKARAHELPFVVGVILELEFLQRRQGGGGRVRGGKITDLTRQGLLEAHTSFATFWYPCPPG